MPNLSNSSQNSVLSKKAKLSTTKFNLKPQNIYRSLVHYSAFANAAGKLLLISSQGDKKIWKKIAQFIKK